MRYAAPFLALFLAACAHDQYTAKTGDPALLSSALWDCKMAVQHQYAYDHRYETMAAGLGGGAAAAVGGGIAAGAAAGAAGGAIAAPSGSGGGKLQLSDLNPAIERCMGARGYVGTSEN